MACNLPRPTPDRPTKYLKLSPLFAALLAAFPAWSQQPVRENAASASPDNTSLPDLAPSAPSSVRLRPRANGLGIDSHDADSRFSVNTETSQRVGSSVGVRGALTLTDTAALGGGVQLGGNGSELYVNLGIGLGNAQRLMFTGGQLKQKLEFAFPSGKTRAEMTQNSGGAAWRFNLGSGLFDYAEATAYTARTASRDLGAVEYAVDTATLYELWRDPRRVAGSTLDGLQAKLGLRPWTGGRASLGFGQERLRYDLLNGTERHTRTTGSLGLEHALDGNTRIKFGADAAAAQGRTTLGFAHRIGDLGTLGVELVNIRGRDGAPNDNRVQVSWTLPLGKASAASLAAARPGPSVRGTAPQTAEGNRLPAARPAQPQTPRLGSDGLLDQVAARPAWMPAQVVAKLDTSAAPTRLIAVDKTALPAGASVDPATGAVAAPLGVAVAGIVGVTKNGIAFANTGQFALSGNSLVINPGLIVQPAVGAIDVYVVTASNADGGTTLITVNVSRGSVRIDSIVVAVVPPAPMVTVDDTNNLIVLGSGVVAADLEVSVADGAYAAYAATTRYSGNVGVKVRVKAMNGNRAGYDTTLAFTEVTPATPAASVDDTNNLVVLGAGAVVGNLEVAVDAGTFAAYNAAMSYAGNHSVKLRVKAMNGNPPSAALTLVFTEVAPAAPAVTANDASDVIVLGAGVVAGNLEVSVDGGAYAAYNAATTYPGSRTVRVRVEAMNGNPAGAVTTLHFTNPAPPTTPPVMGDVPNQPGLTVGTAYSLALAGYVTQTDGNAITGYQIATGSLPTGLSLDTSTGAITGTPSAAGSFTVTVQAQDADGWSNADSVAFTVAALPAGYVYQGNLTWSPNNATVPAPGYTDWTSANTYCTTQTINGQTGWRLPTTAELSSLYSSGAIAGQGWTLNFTWSSTPHGAGNHEFVDVDDGSVGWVSDALNFYVTCVR